MEPSASPARFPRPVLTAIGIAMLLLVCALDGWSDQHAAFTFFFLLPIYFMAWYTPVTWSAPFSVLCYIGMALAESRFEWHSALELLQQPRYFTGLAVFLTTALMLAHLAAVYHRERQLSSHDYLTGVFNRREFFELAEVERQRALRYSRAMTLVFIDLDNFKDTNDRFGHSSGDRILIIVARTLRDCIRSTDLIARLGGDEFVLLLEETDAEAARVIVAKVRETLSERMAQTESRVTASMGVVTFVAPPGSVDAMVNLGDEMMYAAKHQGGDRALFHVSDGALGEENPRKAAGA